MLAEMAPVYANYDVLVTATAGAPAPRLGTWRTIEFWKRASLTTPFNVTGGPALAQCIGFGSGGLPLSMQVVGRPFDDATILRVAHAYEKATPCRTIRPQLDPHAEFSTALPPASDPEPAQIDAATRDRVAVACRAAGLTLSDRQFEMACAAAPHLIAMTGRLNRDRAYIEEPANIFQFGC
jgi:aspartyl-tRNA(Asn)/glutamyl-tRNA(Gln) amidotransferase subunit A